MPCLLLFVSSFPYIKKNFYFTNLTYLFFSDGLEKETHMTLINCSHFLVNAFDLCFFQLDFDLILKSGCDIKFSIPKAFG